MDRNDLNNRVTTDEVIAELNTQIGNLNYELVVTKLAVVKLQRTVEDLFKKLEDTKKKVAKGSVKNDGESF